MLFMYILFVLLFLYLIYKIITQIWWIWVLRNVPSPPSIPIFGHLFNITVPQDVLFQSLRKFSKKYSYYVIWALQWPALHVTAPEDIEVLVSSTKHSDKSEIYLILKDWLKEGLLTSSGKKWHSRRKILTPAFHFNILQQFLNSFVDHSQKLVDDWRLECDKPFVAINPYIIELTLQAICETALGSTLKKEVKDHMEYRELIYRMGELSIYRLVRPWYATVLCYFTKVHWEHLSIARRLHKFTKTFIKQREASFKPSEIPKDNEDYSRRTQKNLAMLDLLLLAKSNGEIDDDGILEEVDTFTFEGHDTTAMNLVFTLMLLANNKEIQDRVVEEMEQVLGGRTRPTYNHLQDLKYLDNCLKESLRLYPSVPIISRSLTETIQFHKHTLPKGLMTNIFIYELHHNPDLYPDPEKFDPDRFLPDNAAGRHPFAYIPFSAGPRNCIGQKFALLEVKTVLLYILREYELLPVDTPQTITLMSDLVLRTKEPIKIKIQPRSHPLPKSNF